MYQHLRNDRCWRDAVKDFTVGSSEHQSRAK
jgi:hypothetical protein